MPKDRLKWEFGDFQTPYPLAQKAIARLKKWNVQPGSIIEPSCGVGGFLKAASEVYEVGENAMGFDINPTYVEEAKARISSDSVSVEVADFFTVDWENLLRRLPQPVFIIGNPPWVTASELGLLGSKNLPQKSNFQKHRGLDAITGKANFDISEWMLLKHFEWLRDRSGIIALLCKVSVARKVLRQMWAQNAPIERAEIIKINAMAHFGAAVDACFFMVKMEPGSYSKTAAVFADLDAEEPERVIAEHEGIILSDAVAFQRSKGFAGKDPFYTWRSGIKHDCSKVMELTIHGDTLRNGLGEVVDLEPNYVFPLLKSSDLSKSGPVVPRKAVIATQKTVGEDTSQIKTIAPKTWAYLMSHLDLLDGRKSTIYRNRPRFSVFGVGGYSYAPYKVAISGFYKNLKFKLLSPLEGQPVMVDDTAYFVPAQSEAEGRFLFELLTSDLATEFFTSQAFWDEKRPITVDLLRRFSFMQAAQAFDRESEYAAFTADQVAPQARLIAS